ncbi:C45 family autoproteolytic acyltransferase/hydolase [Actinomadura vinacea]|uniref:C45 family autoproteolytic acyltransferase/hydolase n=1 Tax=Actinomadura vinacea TaxID=115336 RepID=A0ABN3J3P0_9ACTN
MTFPVAHSPESGPVDRGRAFGTRWRTEVRATAARYDELFAASGAGPGQVRDWSLRALDRTAAWAPDQAREIAAIAEGAGLRPWQVAALNARTEILAALRAGGEGECSTAVTLPGAGLPPRTVQTWDWHDRLREAPLLWEYEPRPGHRVRTFTEFGVLAKIGVNGAGLGVHFNILRHASDHADIGVPVHLVARRILDEAAGVGDALEIAWSARTSASTVITVVAFDGERATAKSIEVCPAGVAAVPVDAGGVLLHSNHFLDPALAVGERLGTERPGTYTRLKHMEDRTGDLGAADATGRAHAMLSHGPDGAPVCAHADPAEEFNVRMETLATIALDVAAGRLLAHRGGPCQVTASTWQVL